MMTFRAFLLATALLAASTAAALAQQGSDGIASPVLHANVTVANDLVRIGDLIDNAGSFAQIAVYRAPDLGTTGTIPTAQVLTALRAHQVIGVDTRNIREVTVTRLARTVESKAIELAVTQALQHHNGLGDAGNLTLTFDRDVQDLRLDAANSGAMQVAAARFEPRSGRFDVTFEIVNEVTGSPTRLRFTGMAVETVDAAVLTRNVDRSDLLKSADIVIERRTKAEIGNDAASREQSLGMQMRRPLRAGQPLRTADLVKPDLVQRDQSVTVIYESPGLYLTTRGKALDSGTEGDVVTVLNPQSKRTVTGVVSGRGQVTIQVATPRPAEDVTSSITSDPSRAAVAKAAASDVESNSRDATASRQKLASSFPAGSDIGNQIASPRISNQPTTPKAE
jgi:flagellar basal body P-ring formation protein FlgA